MLVEVWSDVVCPWCRVGVERFDDAVHRLGWDDRVEIVFRPFELPQKPGRPHPSTFDAHRLLEWALATGGRPAQGALERRLTAAWHTERADPSDHATLARLAADAGLDAGTATEVLASGAYADEVRASEAEAADLDIHGVPTFRLGGLLVVPGAQDPETFVSLLTRVAQRLVGATPDGTAAPEGRPSPA